MSELAQARAAIEREDYPSAIRLLRPAADNGSVEAQFLLGSLYFTSADVDRNESMAWLRRAAAQEHPDALFHLSMDGVSLSSDERRSLLLRAGALGLPAACCSLGCYYAVGEEGIPKDVIQQRYWYSRAAERGDADAQYEMGFMLLYGEGGPQDREAASRWFRLAAEQGHEDARRILSNEIPEP